jgi:hypothetical protein
LFWSSTLIYVPYYTIPPLSQIDMNSSAYERDCISLQLKTAIEEKNHLAVEHKFFIALPDPSEHRNHLSGILYQNAHLISSCNIHVSVQIY